MSAGPSTTAELGALSYMEKGPTRPPAPDAARQAAYDKADKLDTALKTSRDNARDLLRARSKDNAQQPDELRQKAADKLPKAFGTEKNPPPAGSAAEGRMNNAKVVAERATVLAEKGYDGLSATERANVQKDVIDNVLDARPAFASLPAAEKEAIARGMLKDPEAQKLVAAVLAEKLDAELLSPALEQEFNSAREKAETTDQAVRDVQAELMQARVDLGNAVVARDEFMDYSKTPPGVKGPKHDEYVRNMTEKDALQAKIDGRKDWWRNEKAADFAKANGVNEKDPAAQKAGDEWITNLQKTVEQKLAVRTDPSTFSPDEKAMAEMMEWEGEVTRIDKFAEELTNATAKIQELNDKLTGGPPPGELQQKHIDALNARTAAGNELTAMEAKKALQEEALLKGMNGTISEAVNRYVDGSIDARMDQLAAQDQELKSQAKSALENTLADRLKDRWDRLQIDKNGNVKKRTIITGRVSRDMQTMLTGDGPDGVLRDMAGVLGQTEIDAMSAGPAKDTAQKALNEFNEQMKDSPFATKWRAEVAQRVLTRKAQSGKIFEAEMALIIEQPWGQEAINKMIQNSKDLKTAIDKTYAETGAPSYIDRLKRATTKKNLLAALVILFAGGVKMLPSTSSLLQAEGAPH